MSNIITIVDLSEDDDCILETVTYELKDNYSTLHLEACKHNPLLGEFIKKCLNLENTEGMYHTLKNVLLKHYYDLDKSVRDSQKIQKALQEANHNLIIDPSRKFKQIKNLVDIILSSKVKKRVPFITLSKVNTSKKSKLNNSHSAIATPSAFCETICIDADTTNSLEDSLTTESSSKKLEDNSLLVPRQLDIEPANSNDEERIKTIESKIVSYEKEIANLEEMEVDDDSINSPYIRADRLKLAIVELYKELCQLTGSESVKRKEVRLQVSDGHPPEPTRMLESFLNSNIQSNGEPIFPDLMDVVNCVTKANNQYDLGWTKQQIMTEAYHLFVQCGRGLQKRRQRREYQYLMRKVRNTETVRDPADDDPELRLRLEANKRISQKKENEIIERYAMQQTMKAKAKKQKANSINNEANNKTNSSQQKLINNVKISESDIEPKLDRIGNIEEKLNYEVTSVNQSYFKSDVGNEVLKSKEFIHCDGVNNDINDQEVYATCASNIDPKNKVVINSNDFKEKSNDQNSSETGLANKDAARIDFIDSDRIRNNNNDQNNLKMDLDNLNIERKTCVDSGDIQKFNNSNTISHMAQLQMDQSKANRQSLSNCCAKDIATENSNLQQNGTNIPEAELSVAKFEVIEIKREAEDDLIHRLESFGDDCVITIEKIFDPFLDVEISSDSSDEE